MGKRDLYPVHVIELAKDALDERKFRKTNPDYALGKPCVYVGMTGLDPDLRFDKHKAGVQRMATHRYVRQFGLRLMRQRYDVYHPMDFAHVARAA